MSGKIKGISIALVLLLVFVFLGVWVWEAEQQIRSQELHLEYQEKTADYQTERQNLRQQLDKLDENSPYCGDETYLMVGFIITLDEDVEYVREKLEEYPFKPILIVDGSSEIAAIKKLVRKADKDWEILFYAPSLAYDAVLSYSLKKAELERNGRTVSDAVFSRVQSVSEKEVSVLKDAGFSGYTIYHDNPLSGQTPEGMVYFDFSRLASGEIILNDRLSKCYAQKASMLYAFDVESIRNGNLHEDKVLAYLETLTSYTKKENCSFSSVSHVMETLSLLNQKKAELDALRAAQREEILKRINELDDIIGEIHSEYFPKYS